MISPFYFTLSCGSVAVLWGSTKLWADQYKPFMAWGDHGWYVPIKWECV